MSTSCIVGIYDSRRPQDIVLLEKTHDGFKETVTKIINTIVEKYDISDVEELVNALIKETSIEFAIYSHKHPYYAFIYDVYKKNIIEVCIDPSISRINDCLEKIKDYMKAAKDEKPKVIINTELTFDDDLKEELQGYIDNIYKGPLEKYDVNNF